MSEVAGTEKAGIQPLVNDGGELGGRIRDQLADSLRRPHYQGNPNPAAGHCYVASEAYYHLRGGKAAGLTPMRIRHEGEPHWFIREQMSGENIDLTAGQFVTPVPYEKGVGCGFLTREPSVRAAQVIGGVRAKLALEQASSGRGL